MNLQLISDFFESANKTVDCLLNQESDSQIQSHQTIKSFIGIHKLNSLVVVFTLKSYCANYNCVLLIVEVVDRKKHAKRRRGGTAAGLQPTCGFTQLSGALLYARACAYERVCREKSCPTKSGWTAGIGIQLYTSTVV